MGIFSFLSFVSLVSAGGINPFSDDDLFAINWAGTADVERLKNVNLIFVFSILMSYLLAFIMGLLLLA